MNSRTFCLMLAGFLFALSAGTYLLLTGNKPEDSVAEQTIAQAEPVQKLISPTGSWQEAGMFGAQYSEEYGQWSLRNDITFRISEDTPVAAPLTGVVKSIEEMKGGGSRVTIQCADATQILLYPVYSLRIFSGSRIEQGDIIGVGKKCLSLEARKDGQAIDPLQLAGY